MLVVVVTVGWLLYIGSWMRARTESRRSNSIHSFSKHLSVLGGTTPARSIHPGASVIPLRPGMLDRRLPTRGLTLGQARRRRRDVLVALGGATVVFGALSLFVGGLANVLFVLSAVLLAAYVGLLARAQRIGGERRAKVRYLPSSRSVEPVLLLQRSAN